MCTIPAGSDTFQNGAATCCALYVATSFTLSRFGFERNAATVAHRLDWRRWAVVCPRPWRCWREERSNCAGAFCTRSPVLARVQAAAGSCNHHGATSAHDLATVVRGSAPVHNAVCGGARAVKMTSGRGEPSPGAAVAWVHSGGRTRMRSLKKHSKAVQRKLQHVHQMWPHRAVLSETWPAPRRSCPQHALRTDTACAPEEDGISANCRWQRRAVQGRADHRA